jgi:putative aldouronate transport system permease protein
MQTIKLEPKTELGHMPKMSFMRKLQLKKVNAGDVIFVIVNTLVLTFMVAITLYPILNTLAVSFNDGLDALKGNIYLIPRVISLKAYKTVFNMDNLLTGAKNSVLRTVIAAVFHLGITALLAYVLSIREFVFRKGISLFFVMTMYVNAGLIPTFLLYRSLGLTGTFWVYVVPGIVAAFNLLVLRTYMASLPDSLRESAQIDGANHLTIFWKIYCPMCKPVFATIALFIAVYHWSSWFDNMIYNRMNTELTTLQYELMKLLSSVSSQTSSGSAYGGGGAKKVSITPVTIRAAATIVTSMPIVILYPFLQRYFVTGLTIGGVKE